MIEMMRALLDALHSHQVDAYGIAHRNGTVQLTIKGEPTRTAEILGRFFDALMADLVS